MQANTRAFFGRNLAELTPFQRVLVDILHPEAALEQARLDELVALAMVAWGLKVRSLVGLPPAPPATKDLVEQLRDHRRSLGLPSGP